MESVLTHAAQHLLMICRTRHLRVATAESCTGGLISAAITAIPGSSDVLDRAFVTYSNEAKTEMLGVPAGLIEAVGAVSEAVAARMATGALHHSRADLAVSVTGIAGPGGGSADKPVGTVWFGAARRGGGHLTDRRVFPGDRDMVRVAAAHHALRLLERLL